MTIVNIVIDIPWPTVLTAGEIQEGTLKAPGGKLVFEVTGPGAAIVGVYQGIEPVGHHGKLRIEPGQKRGVRMLDPVIHLVTVNPVSAGPFTLLVRKWTFWDYFQW